MSLLSSCEAEEGFEVDSRLADSESEACKMSKMNEPRNESMSNGIGTHRDLVCTPAWSEEPWNEIERVISRLTLDNVGRNAVGGQAALPATLAFHFRHPS